jgi:uncharacterized membrane protein
MSAPTRFSFGTHIAPIRFLLFAGVQVGATALLSVAGASLRTAMLAGFDVGAVVFLVSLLSLLSATPDAMRRIAERNDANRAGLLAITVLLSLVILFAVGTLIAGEQTLQRIDIALIVSTLVLTWLFANTVFALHYAHLYYLRANGADRGGLDIPAVTDPDYWDFLYFSFTLGMTFQTSDVSITGAHIRRVVLGHCMAAFVFNMGVLAFTVNALGGSGR